MTGPTLETLRTLAAGNELDPLWRHRERINELERKGYIIQCGGCIVVTREGMERAEAGGLQ